MVEEVHKNDIGTKFLVTIKDGTTVVDISGASGDTDKQIIFEKPDGTVITKNATFDTDGTDGKIYYITIDEDLNLSGQWKIQAKVVLADGTWRTSIDDFEVYENLE